MNSRGTIRLAFALGVAALWLPLLASWRAQDGYRGTGFLITGGFTVPITLLVAAPLVYVFRRRLSFLLSCLFGIALSLIGLLPDLITGHWGVANGLAQIIVPAGLISSMLFWLVGVRGNRDLTCVGADREG
jgi:hypothetical protein